MRVLFYNLKTTFFWLGSTISSIRLVQMISMDSFLKPRYQTICFVYLQALLFLFSIKLRVLKWPENRQQQPKHTISLFYLRETDLHRNWQIIKFSCPNWPNLSMVPVLSIPICHFLGNMPKMALQNLKTQKPLKWHFLKINLTNSSFRLGQTIWYGHFLSLDIRLYVLTDSGLQCIFFSSQFGR
jgi:hypothetical protein